METKKSERSFGHFCHPLNPHIRHSLALRLQSVSDLELVTVVGVLNPNKKQINLIVYHDQHARKFPFDCDYSV